MTRWRCAICSGADQRRSLKPGWHGRICWIRKAASARAACRSASAHCCRLDAMKKNRPPSSGRRPRQTPADDARWADLRRLTAARIGLKRTGASLATGPLLDFQLAHARARDAVHEPFDAARLAADLAADLVELAAPVLTVASAATDRQRYLMRPDLGRQLAPGAEAVLAPHAGRYDIVFVVADGLSARAVAAHAQPVLSLALPAMRADGWRIGPLVIVCQGRVAVGDAIAIV